MASLPNFIIVGVARCGTTSLYHYLNQHPEISLSKVKEPKYFSSLDLTLPQNGVGDITVDKKIIKDEKNYDKLFSELNNFKCIGDASSDYFYYHKNVIPHIKKKLGDVKIIICLRNPVDRSFSAYNNLIRDSRETLSFADALNQEEDRIYKNWDWMWHYKKGSLYADALEHFQNEFSNVEVVFFEDLANNTTKVLQKIFNFLDVNDKIKIDVNTLYSSSGKPKNAIFAQLTSRNNPIIFWAREVALKTIPRKYLEKFALHIFKKDEIESNVIKNLKEYFREDITKLEKLTKKQLNSWK